MNDWGSNNTTLAIHIWVVYTTFSTRHYFMDIEPRYQKSNQIQMKSKYDTHNKTKLKIQKIMTKRISKRKTWDTGDDLLLLGYTELPLHEIQHAHFFLHSATYPGPGWPKYLSDYDLGWKQSNQCRHQVDKSSRVQNQKYRPVAMVKGQGKTSPKKN